LPGRLQPAHFAPDVKGARPMLSCFNSKEFSQTVIEIKERCVDFHETAGVESRYRDSVLQPETMGVSQ
jgi:hypothetical protein